MQTPIVPTTGGTGSAPAASAPLPSGTATVSPGLPPSLAQALQNGATLTAQVTAKPATGQLTLSVQGQTVQVQTPLPLPPGTNLAVALQSVSSGGQATLFLQPQTSGAAQTGTAVTGQQPAPQTIQTTAPQPAVVTNTSVGSVLSGTITALPTSAASASTATTAQTAPTAQQTAQTTVNTAAQPTGGGTPAPTAPAQSPLPVLPPGSAVQLRLLAFAPPGQSLASSAPGAFTGTVTGQTGNGSVSVQTPMGTVNLSMSHPPPTGTQLMLGLVGTPKIAAFGSAAAQGSAARYQALQDAVALLKSGDPALAQRMTQSLLPQPNAQMGLAAVFLLSAMRQGGTEKWLGGDTARGIDAAGRAAGKSGLLSELDSEVTPTHTRTRDTAGQDWRVTSLPLMNGNQVDEIRLYTRDRPKDEENGKGGGKKEDAKRFVVEASFSHLGPIQLDGLSRDKKVDVVVRSQRALPPEARDDIRGLFADTVSALGLSGQVEFSVVSHFDLVPNEDIPHGLTV